MAAPMDCWPTDAAEGQVATEARWRKMARLWTPSGVAEGVAGKLHPPGDAGQVTVAPGGCWIDGHYAETDTPATLEVGDNGLVVARYTAATGTAELDFVADASEATRTDAVWELTLAVVDGGAVTDRRTFTDSFDRTVAAGQPRATLLADTTPAAVGNPANWGGVTLPGVPAGTWMLLGHVVGQVTFQSTTASRRQAQTRLGYNLDGVWTDGPLTLTELHGNDQRSTAVVAGIAATLTVATPGDVLVRTLVTQNQGASGELSFRAGMLTASLVPA